MWCAFLVSPAYFLFCNFVNFNPSPRMQIQKWFTCGLSLMIRSASGHRTNALTLSARAVHVISKSNLSRASHPTVLPLSSSLPHKHSAVGTARHYCSLTDSDVKKRVEKITNIFFDARELLEDAVRCDMHVHVLARALYTAVPHLQCHCYDLPCYT